MRLTPVLFLMLAPTLAFAESDSRTDKILAKAQEKFAEADADHDAKLTLDEAKNGMPRVAKKFDEIDTDKKGYVTLDQIEAYLKARADK